MTAPDLTHIPALTITQPWATAISHGGKNIENRPWRPPAHITHLLIHAGKTWDPVGVRLLREARPDLLQRAIDTRGAVVAIAELAGVCDRGARHDRCDCGPWAADGQYHWRLTNVRALPKPVPVRGMQRLWWLPGDVLATVHTHLHTLGTEATPMSGARLRSIPGTRSGDMERHTGAEREPTALDGLIAELLAERFRGPVRRPTPHQRRPIQRGHEDTDLDRARSCDGKVQHPTREAAYVAMLRFIKAGASHRGLAAYRCRYCGGFHVGHRSKPRVRRA